MSECAPTSDPRVIAADIARELRDDPTRWTRRVNARNVHGGNVNVADDSAVCWCFFGHLLKRLGNKTEEVAYELQKLAGIDSVVKFNDEPGRTVYEVIALCDSVANHE